ncbi:hypothetical protein ACOMHN_010431 [Nucella lapillus]
MMKDFRSDLVSISQGSLHSYRHQLYVTGGHARRGKDFRHGSACYLEVCCRDCGKVSWDFTSKKSGSTHTGFDVNRRIVIAVQKFNQGSTALLNILLELELMQNTRAAEYGEQEDVKRVNKATRRSSQQAQEKRKKIDDIRRRECQAFLAREGLAYGAGEY